MLVRYYHYNHLEPAIEQFMSSMNENMHINYASKLLDSLIKSPEFDMEDSVKKAIAVFRLTGIPVHEHISGIYCSDGIRIRKNWRLSELACSVVILTSDVTNNEARVIKDRLINYLGL
jgi:predicted metallo-beta-lactamase superfamily hydrolase